MFNETKAVRPHRGVVFSYLWHNRYVPFLGMNRQAQSGLRQRHRTRELAVFLVMLFS